MSDGRFLYWLYALRTPETVPHAVTGERVKQHLVYLQVLKIEVCMCVCVCVCVPVMMCTASTPRVRVGR